MKSGAGINDYHPLPAYDPETSMDFHDRESWDARCRG